VDALSEGLGTEDGETDREELSEDSTDNDGLETVVGSHGDGNDLGLIAHLSGNEHHGEEDVAGHTAAAEVLELLAGLSERLVLVVVMVVDTVGLQLTLDSGSLMLSLVVLTSDPGCDNNGSRLSDHGDGEMLGCGLKFFGPRAFFGAILFITVTFVGVILLLVGRFIV